MVLPQPLEEQLDSHGVQAQCRLKQLLGCVRRLDSGEAWKSVVHDPIYLATASWYYADFW